MAGIIFFYTPMPAPTQDSAVPLGHEVLYLMGHQCLVRPIKVNDVPDMHEELFFQSTKTLQANSVQTMLPFVYFMTESVNHTTY
jgi:hypothetical protein